MTREEAIKILEEEAEFLYGGDEPYNKIAFDMAIKALEDIERWRTWSHTYDNLISRQEAIEMAVDVETPQGAYEKAIYVDDLMALPSADRPTGEWVDAEIPIESGRAMPIQVCNLCNTFYPLAHTGGGYHFCPNCGAKMGGDSDG